MAAIHYKGVPCNTKVKKNPLEVTKDKSLVTCKKCLKKLAVVQDTPKAETVVEEKPEVEEVPVVEEDLEYELEDVDEDYIDIDWNLEEE